jgi:tetraacyldisaccharide 4'-kinase
LRAPLRPQIARAQALLVVGEPGPAAQPAIDGARARGLPVFTGRLVPDPAVVAALAARPALAFAGIADPEKFFATLRGAGIALGATQAFPDHHRFGAAQAHDLITHAERGGLALVTTEKDLARMQGDPALAALARRATALPVALSFDDAGSIGRLLAAVRAA